jgi:putative transposase
LRRQLNYKTCWQGGQLIVADRVFPSSKTCSACGMVKAKLSLTERGFTCERCGLVIDRDVNAAKNLFLLAVSGRGPGGAEVREPHEAGLVGTPVRLSLATFMGPGRGQKLGTTAGPRSDTR